MRAKRIYADEQLKLIMECRRSGLSDYQWCQMHEINPGTFYNWISRLRKQGASIPISNCPEEITPFSQKQEVVKVGLIPDPDMTSPQVEQNTRILTNLASNEHPAFEILTPIATIRFYNGTDPRLIETTLGCLGGVLNAR